VYIKAAMEVKPEIEGNAEMRSLTGDAKTQDVTLVNIAYFWDNVSIQVNKIFNIVIVAFGYFNSKMLHIVPF